MIGVSSKGIAVARSRLRRALDLVFAGAQTLDPRVTFSRTSNATLTNSAGLVAYAPHNLLTYSEQFDNAVWLKSNATVTANAIAAPNGTAIAAPNGTATADLFVGTGVAANYIYAAYAATAGVAYYLSCYVKDNNLTATKQVWLRDFTEAGLARFNLSTGTVDSVTGIASDAKITDVGNGWYRISAKFSPTVSGNHNVSPVHIGLSASTASFYAWGAQLNIGELQDYNPTTVKNLLGYTEHFDNAAWTKSNAFVQTNLLLQSVFSGAVAGTPGTAPTNWPFILTGGSTAVYANGVTLSSNAGTRHFIAQSVALAANTQYTLSINLSAYSGPSDAIVLLNTSAGSISSGQTSIAGTTDLGRKSITFTAGATGATVDIRLGIGVQVNVSANASVSFDSPQLVQGTSAGDYKATYATAAAVGYSDIYGQPFAQKLVENTATGFRNIYVARSSTVGEVLTRSVYVKAGERTWAGLYVQDGAGVDFLTYLNLSTGVLGTVPTGVTASVQNVGDGWYRFSVTRTVASAFNSVVFSVFPTTGNNVFSYTGDGTSGIYIFGAQLSDSASVDPYVYNPVAAPTAQAYYGPRFDYDASTATYTESYGPELVTNGDFSAGSTGWTLGSNTTVSGGTLNIASGAAASTTTATITASKSYKVTYTITSVTTPGAGVRVRLGGTASGTFQSTTGTYTEYLTASTSNAVIVVDTTIGTFVGSLDNITVKEYLGTTGTGATPKGLLIEEQRTNLLTYSEQFDNASWSKSSATVTPNAAVSPDGTVDADLIVSSTYVRQSVPIPAAAARYTTSVYAKAAASNSFSITEAGATASSVSFNLATGTFVITDTGGSPSATITPVGNSWFRCTFSYTSNGVQTTLFMNLNPANAYLWGSQLEAGAFATSYIPTVASQVTRAADSASMIGNNFARWYNVSEGSAFVDVLLPSTALVDCYPLRISGASSLVFGYKDVGTTVRPITGTVAGAGLSTTAAYKVSGAYSFTANEKIGAVNGVLATPLTTTGALGQNIAAEIGGFNAGAGKLNGTIKRIAYYPRRLSNAELQGVTS